MRKSRQQKLKSGPRSIIAPAPRKVRKTRKGTRKLGILKGKLIVGPEFFEPLPPEELNSWE
jgi:hypothetical protein